MIFSSKSKSSLKITLRRVGAVLVNQSKEQIAECKMFLGDMTKQGAKLFSAKSVVVGEPVTIEIHSAQPIAIRGKISACRLLSLHDRILGRKPMNYRVSVMFELTDPAEQKRIEEYVEQLNAA